MRLPLLDGQGNFGSMDGDPPAAYRYTEVRMEKVARALLDDIDKDTVDFVPNYANERQEPTVLPARFPNLLVNGGGGIAVGMATNIPPHNLGEVIDATLALIENPELTISELMEILPAPDFPTGATILGRSGAYKAYHTGRGSVIVRAKTHLEELRKDRWAIIVDEIPYQVNKSNAGRAHRRGRAREEDRGHRPCPGRERPPRRAHRHRAEARGDTGRGAEPALPVHGAADFVRLQHAGAERRAARAAGPEDVPGSLHRVPRGRGGAAHGLSAATGARACPRVVRPGRRGRERRRGGGDDPRFGGCGRGAGEAEGPALARRGDRRVHPADRRPRPHDQRGRDLQPVRHAGPRDPGPAAAAPDRDGRQRDRRGA